MNQTLAQRADGQRRFPFFDLDEEEAATGDRFEAIEGMRLAANPEDQINRNWDDRLQSEYGLVEEYLAHLGEFRQVLEDIEKARYDLGWLDSDEGYLGVRMDLADHIEELETRAEEIRDYIEEWDGCERAREFTRLRDRYCADRGRMRARMRSAVLSIRPRCRVRRPTGVRRAPRRASRKLKAASKATADPDSPAPGERARQRALTQALIEAARAGDITTARDRLAWTLVLGTPGGAA